MLITNDISAIIIAAEIRNGKIMTFTRNVELFKSLYPQTPYKFVFVAIDKDGNLLNEENTNNRIRGYYNNINDLVEDVTFAANINS